MELTYKAWDMKSPINGRPAQEMLEQHSFNPETDGLIFISVDEYGQVYMFQYDKENPYESLEKDLWRALGKSEPEEPEEPPDSEYKFAYEERNKFIEGLMEGLGYGQ